MLKNIMKYKCNSKKGTLYVEGGRWSKVGEGILRGASWWGEDCVHSFTDSSLGAFRI
jgi:beta-N-acetylglucosaminidase